MKPKHKETWGKTTCKNYKIWFYRLKYLTQYMIIKCTLLSTISFKPSSVVDITMLCDSFKITLD